MSISILFPIIIHLGALNVGPTQAHLDRQIQADRWAHHNDLRHAWREEYKMARRGK